jgi:hypothetical protein
MIDFSAHQRRNKYLQNLSVYTKDVDRKEPVFSNRGNNKSSAIMFAANRTARVPGRIKFLIISIHTINGIRMGGIP